MTNRDAAFQAMIDQTKEAILESDGELNMVASKLDCNTHQAWIRVRDLGLATFMMQVRVKAEERFRENELKRPRQMNQAHFYSEEALE